VSVSLDARGILEVNRLLIVRAAQDSVAAGETRPRVVSMATWGRGCKPEVLRKLQPFNRVGGYNASLVATPDASTLRELLGPDVETELDKAAKGQFLAIGVALGETVWEWWNLDGSNESEDLF
jgi:hypothetical protein